jgi:Zn finger protein HypA/HybF involved in hydrogenase expression
MKKIINEILDIKIEEIEIDYYCYNCKAHFRESEDVTHPRCHFCDSDRVERF